MDSHSLLSSQVDGNGFLRNNCKLRIGKKKELSRNKSWRPRRDPRNVGLPSLLWHSAQLRRQSCQSLFTLKGIPWYSFLLEAEWTPGLLSADRSNRSVDNFQGPYRKSKPKTPLLWSTAQISRKAIIAICSSCKVRDIYDVIRHRPRRLSNRNIKIAGVIYVHPQS